MADIPLRSLPAPPPGASVLIRAGEGTVIFDGDYTGPAYTCGGCGAVLIDGVRGAHLVDLVLSCNICGAWNASPAADPHGIDPAAVERPVVFPPGQFELTAPATVHARWVMASETALEGTALGIPVPYAASRAPVVADEENEEGEA